MFWLHMSSVLKAKSLTRNGRMSSKNGHRTSDAFGLGEYLQWIRELRKADETLTVLSVLAIFLADDAPLETRSPNITQS